MCGRFYLDVDGDELMAYFDLSEAPELRPRYNIAPSEEILAVLESDGARACGLFRWGLIPFWAKDEKIGYSTINARMETVESKPAFRAAFKRRRCLIPASGYYEWKAESSGKQPYCVRPGQGPLFAFAGLYERWQSPQDDRAINSCTIIVTDASDVLSPVHDRMSVILKPEQFSAWLNPAVEGAAKLKPLLQNPSTQEPRIYPVTKRMGNPRFDRVDCIKPLD